MSNPPNSRVSQQRQHGFLQGLHNLMAIRGMPLPPALTGIPVPNYDHSTSPWSAIEPGSEVGTFKVAGKDVNLFRLWGTVFQNGGGRVLEANNAWASLLPQFDLPEEFPTVQANGSTSVAKMLSQYYMAILLPFEESYRKNMQENQRKASLANRQAMMGNAPMPGSQPMPQQAIPNNAAQMQRNVNTPVQGMVGGGQPANGMPRYPSMPPQPQSRPASGMLMQGADSMLPTNHAPDLNMLDQDGQGIKRKLEIGDLEKRARPRTEPQPGSPMSIPSMDRNPSEPPPQVPQAPSAPAVAPPRPRTQPSRRKIEYIPLAREVDTYGGRDLRFIEGETVFSAQRRPLRELNDWGTVDIECLTMSIRSRLGPELSYALTTFTLLSTMRGQTPGSGFPIQQCPDLLEEALDLVEDIAFGGYEESHDPTLDSFDDDASIVTNHQLVNHILDEQSLPFAGLEPHQGSKDADLGPQQRPANYIVTVFNIIRNLTVIDDNIRYLAHHTRLLDVLLRTCKVVEKDGAFKPASPALSLNDLVLIRKDMLYSLLALSGFTNLASPDIPPKAASRITKRIFELIASYLIDPQEAVPPTYSVQHIGIPFGGNMRPSTLVQIALETWNHFSQPDPIRKLMVKAIPHHLLWTLFEALVHRLPMSDLDFQLVSREIWLSHLEAIIMAIYSLAFMAPPDLKEKMRSDRKLKFNAISARMLQRFFMNGAELRAIFLVCARRVTETLKVLDDKKDPFENPVDSTGPTLSFGMGFADASDNGPEKGTGLLGGYSRDLWPTLTLREVQSDEIMFGELESLVRVECQ
ncbi:hypothetical protein CC2G_000985 [Coprinopsis cinerea AmutBmut pab1-1]|nr:hypothetical protein CC2G_000985 [Coprinopsis cinerea AmutBmut pab1-1]